MEFNGKTTGTVTEVKKIRWIKIKLKAVRLHPTDGVAFPHGVKVKYKVGGREYIKKIYFPWRILPPPKGAEITVEYNKDRPSVCRVGAIGGK